MLCFCNLLFQETELTVLIVDDNSGVRRLLRKTVAAMACTIWESSDGADGVEQYRIHRPDLVLMDIQMPQLDGLTATRRIVEFHSSARVVIVTDYDDGELRKAAKEAGACAYIPKLDLGELERWIRDMEL